MDKLSELAAHVASRIKIPRWHYLTAPLTSTSWDGDTHSTTAKTVLDLSTVFGVPENVKAVDVYVSVKDSGSAGADTYLILGPTNTANKGKVFSPMTVNSREARYSAVVPCDANGDFYYQIAASGASTFGVMIEIWGYYL